MLLTAPLREGLLTGQVGAPLQDEDHLSHEDFPFTRRASRRFA
jgi:hypothetical protein